MAVLFRRERQFGVSVVLGFVCVNLRDLRETLGFLCADRLNTLACYSLADSADYAEECSRAALFRRERQFEMVVRLLWFLWFVCDYQRDLRETLRFFLW